jgi:hypothetical protein
MESTDLLSLPFANWSLALEHSPVLPDFSQAVHAGNLPSHLKTSATQFITEKRVLEPLFSQRDLFFGQIDGNGEVVEDLHLEHAETGLETLNNGVSATLGLERGIFPSPVRSRAEN